MKVVNMYNFYNVYTVYNILNCWRVEHDRSSVKFSKLYKFSRGCVPAPRPRARKVKAIMAINQLQQRGAIKEARGSAGHTTPTSITLIASIALIAAIAFIALMAATPLLLSLPLPLRLVCMTPAGLEPAIPGSVGRCLIHWATGPADLIFDCQ